MKHRAAIYINRWLLYQIVSPISIVIGDKHHGLIAVMSGLSINGTNGTQHQRDDALLPGMSGLSLSSQAIHADDFLNVNQDVAPALHVSTTFRYSKIPDKLVPSHQIEVREGMISKLCSKYLTCIARTARHSCRRPHLLPTHRSQHNPARSHPQHTPQGTISNVRLRTLRIPRRPCLP